MDINWGEFQDVEGNATERMWPEKGKPLTAGETIMGRYVQKKEDVGDNHSNVYVLELSAGDRVGVWGSTVLDTKFESIAIGKMVAIKYLGDKPSPNRKGKTYKDFRVAVGIDVPGDENK